MPEWDQVQRLRKVPPTVPSDGWNEWRRQHSDIRIDLSEAHLVGDQLVMANLEGADLRKVDMRQVNLNQANLRGADLRQANLIWTTFVDADLSGANLGEGHLTATQLHGTSLRGANFSGTHLFSTVFADVDLSGVIGLETCHHEGPSILDHRTLGRSGRLPLAFLRGCGLPDDLISFLPSLLGGRAIEYHSCFISYSAHDQDFADRLHADLQNHGVRCWFAPHNIQGGRKLHEQIDEAIRIHDKLLLILSPTSMTSEWVKTEIGKARKREIREKRRMLFPLRLVDFDNLRDWECFDADTGNDSAREIREYFIPDFSQWKTDHDAYKQALERLLHDLKSA
jgi:uncharacterized protein YjbI with pentapeptide repeats